MFIFSLSYRGIRGQRSLWCFFWYYHYHSRRLVILLLIYYPKLHLCTFPDWDSPEYIVALKTMLTVIIYEPNTGPESLQASTAREDGNDTGPSVPDLTGQIKLVKQYPVYEANYSDVFLGVWKDPKKHQKVGFQPFLPHCILNQDLVSGESYSGGRTVS
jgi:hypothetical protein